MIVWQDGELLEEDQVRISPFDMGLTVGMGVFETLIVERGRPFAWTRHYKRLCAGAKVMGIAPPEAGRLSRAAAAVIKANEFESARMRITLTGGAGGPGVSKKGDPVCLVTATPLVAYPECARVGISGEVVDIGNRLSGVKSLSYANHILAMAEGRRTGWDEVLMFNRMGHLCEGASCNIFLEIAGEVKTPPLQDGCLPGVTRQLILELLKSEGVPVEETSLSLEDLERCDGVWLSSSIRHIQWASMAAEGLFPEPSPLFRRIRARFEELRLENSDP